MGKCKDTEFDDSGSLTFWFLLAMAMGCWYAETQRPKPFVTENPRWLGNALVTAANPKPKE